MHDTLAHPPRADPAELVAATLMARWAAVGVDVETDPAQDQRIFQFGAARVGTHEGLRLEGLALARLPERLDAFAAGAACLVGHHLRRHDLPQLHRQHPGARSLALPLIDTLEWSALAFPANPYHRLVKGYKLVGAGRNDAQRDARLALNLLADELAAFQRMHAQDAIWVAILHTVMRHDAMLSEALTDIRAAPPPNAGGALALIRQRLGAQACATRLAALQLPDDPTESLALAYALGWVRVAGGNSVLPAWVLKTFPQAREHIAAWRERDCGSPHCGWCRVEHDPEAHLKRCFGKPSYRAHPPAPDGGSLQRAIVVAGLQRRSLLAVLPTGGGKSICYQVPALVHFQRAGRLTVIVSPLQSLMKDQVDNLLAAGITCAVTLNGLLTPPERHVALEKIRLGDAGIVLVSPEQFRSRAFAEALALREIAAWVFDEAHCLSKWGHDFRTDYLYVARFIRERFGADAAPVACFTATAKPDVIDDLRGHFREQLGLELQTFLGGHERRNLSYRVLPTTAAAKAQHVVGLLDEHLGRGRVGAAVIFCATRKQAQEMARMVSAQGRDCGCFHGGLPAEEKKDVQQRFLAGELPVIAATNAFGMGVDKPDIRLVVHAAIPGSLENYLQEAGRAGRDGEPAHAVLLFDEADVEQQFRLAAQSRLTLRDFNGLLGGVRQRMQRMRRDEVVVTTGELLAASEATDIAADGIDANTKVTTAVAWLERSGFLQRNENDTRVFPTSMRVPTLQVAEQRIDAAGLPQRQQLRFKAVVAALFANERPDGVSTDSLMLEAGIAPDEAFRILSQLQSLGILVNDLGLSVRLVRGGPHGSTGVLEHVGQTEKALLDLMAEAAPDADDGTPQPLAIRPLCSALRERLGLPATDSRLQPRRVTACLRALAEGFGPANEQRAMLTLRNDGAETFSAVLLRRWQHIREICRLRFGVAHVVLRTLLDSVPAEAGQGSLIVECKARELLEAIEGDLALRSQLREPAIALEQALLYLHGNGVVELDRGRSLLRHAMTLKADPTQTRRRFLKEDFAPLEEFYRERTLQTHVMHEYARLGHEDAPAAVRLVRDYFTLPRKDFLRSHFRGRLELLELGTTDESHRRIVADLNHPAQQRLVEAPERGNHLILAGPGAGKTKVLAHRIAWLLRVRRVAPERILALTFNRHAAVELRRRVLALAGEDARRVPVLTYHALALRLTGTSLAVAAEHGHAIDFDRVLQDAIDLLEGRGSEGALDADVLREQLLGGIEHIFVDEYQDIDERQYQLVGALVGRRLADKEARLSITAVGDDDQNIYAFKGADVGFIRRFQQDYEGETSWLVENFRSTQHIIATANHVIQPAAGRMKVDHPIAIDSARRDAPPGGRWQTLDPLLQGRVHSIAVPADPNLQAQVAWGQIERLAQRDPQLRPGDVAVLARTHATLAPMRACAEAAGWRCEVAGRDPPPALRLREGAAVLDVLRARPRGRLLRLAALRRWMAAQARRAPSPHWEALDDVLAEPLSADGLERWPVSAVLDLLHEAALDARRRGDPLALKLTTAHGAKGLEFDHVVILDPGDWSTGLEDERRLYYVAMTRARQTLTLLRPQDGRNTLLSDLGGLDGVVTSLPDPWPQRRQELDRRWRWLGPAELDLSLAGRRAPDHPIHAALARLRVGDPLRLRGRDLVDGDGVVVARLARKVEPLPDGAEGRVHGLLARCASEEKPEWRDQIRVERWELPLIELDLGIAPAP